MSISKAAFVALEKRVTLLERRVTLLERRFAVHHKPEPRCPECRQNVPEDGVTLVNPQDDSQGQCSTYKVHCKQCDVTFTEIYSHAAR